MDCVEAQTKRRRMEHIQEMQIQEHCMSARGGLVPAHDHMLHTKELIGETALSLLYPPTTLPLLPYRKLLPYRHYPTLLFLCDVSVM